MSAETAAKVVALTSEALTADLNIAKWKEIVPESKWPIANATGVAGRLFVKYLDRDHAQVTAEGIPREGAGQ